MGTVVLQLNVCVVMKMHTGDSRAVKGSSCVLHPGGALEGISWGSFCVWLQLEALQLFSVCAA